MGVSSLDFLPGHRGTTGPFLTKPNLDSGRAGKKTIDRNCLARGELGCVTTGRGRDRGSAPPTGELSRDKPELDDRGTRGRKGARSDYGDGGLTHRRFFCAHALHSWRRAARRAASIVGKARSRPKVNGPQTMAPAR